MMLFELPHWILVKDALWHDGKSPIVSRYSIYIIFQLLNTRFLNHQPFFQLFSGGRFFLWNMDMAFAKRRQFVAAYLIETWMNCLSNRCPKVGGTFEVCEYEGFPEILQEGKIPRDTSPHQSIILLSPGSKSHEMLGDMGDTQIPTKMFGFFKLNWELQVGTNQNLQTKSGLLGMTSLVLQVSDKSSQKQTCNERPLLIYEMI